jgi:hypothetical protein
MRNEQLPHLLIEGFFGTERYTASPRRGPEFPLPARDRTTHGTSVREQLDKIRGENEQNRGGRAEPDKPAPIPIEVRSEPGFVLNLESLENRAKGIEVACVRTEGDVQVATVQVPEGALTHFLKLVEKYLTEDTKGTGRTPPRPKHQDLINRVSELRLATLRSFWTDDEEGFPPPTRAVWWEVWLLVRGDQGPWDSFRMLAEANGLSTGTDTIRFPDRLVALAYGTAEQLTASAELLDMIGEVRRAKENPADFIGLPPKDQAEWVKGLLARVTAPPPNAPAVCLLDAGVVGNPLVRPALVAEDCHRFAPNWPLADTSTHGTEMAGVALYGNRLADLLTGGELVTLRHRLESVKVLPPPPRHNEPRLYGHVTAQAISRVEIAQPDRKRSFCMAITADGRDRGKPSSWSGVIDQLAAGISDEHPRLFFISAGNTDPSQRHHYPNSNDTDNVQDPAQAWNAVTVGACTDYWRFDRQEFPGYAPLAPPGDLSPSSTTSVSFERAWPYKPDIVLEGGNQILLPGTSTVMDPDEMAMLTTSHATGGPLLVGFRDTSAATAEAARMAAILQAEYPSLWPEAVRALLIHSAKWTGPMRAAFGPKKGDAVNRLRRYGYGRPSLGRAVYSARSSLTLVAQQAIRPFSKEGGDVKTKDMGLHSLPWPKEQLLALGGQEVTMRVTLSYFIEPKPGRRDGFATSRHRYPSHGLRFEVKRPQETLDDLRKRVSNAAREEEETYAPVGDTAGWALGPQVRTRGSVHSDWWTGTAADLANCGFIAVYPVSGWWRESKGNHWSKEARYALIVSIRTEKTRVDLFTPLAADVDLYTPVDTAIKAAVSSPVEAEVTNEGGSSGGR